MIYKTDGQINNNIYNMHKICFFLLNILFTSVTGYIPQTCTKLTPCVCRDENGQYVDLRPLSNDDGTPFYKDHGVDASSEAAKYSFNPCNPFSEGRDNSSCHDVAVCRILGNGQKFVDIGTEDSATFSHFDNGNLSLEFTSSNQKQHTIVSLYCNSDIEQAVLRVVGDMGNMFWLQLRSKHCCPKPKSELQDIDVTFDSNSNVTMPVPPHVVTMTSKPDPVPHKLDTITTILLAILGSVVVGLAVLFVLLFKKTFMKRRKLGTNVFYQPLPTEDSLDFLDKDFEISFS